MRKTHAAPSARKVVQEGPRSRGAAVPSRDQAIAPVPPLQRKEAGEPALFEAPRSSDAPTQWRPSATSAPAEARTPGPWRAPGGTPAIQAKSGRPLKPTTEVHEAARHGTSGAGGRLPHFDQIQRVFGRHDVSGIVAHTDEAAASGAKAMGAEAFTFGRHVAFDGTPSLHTVAHEAAHAIQQQSGVQLLGGVGQPGDRYEENAEAVAAAAVQGRSCEPLLDAFAGGAGPVGSAQPPVQKMAQSRFGLKQTGGTCGLYSLGMAITAVDSDIKSQSDADALMPKILTAAVETGTFVGEFFDAENLAKVAQKVGYTAQVVDFNDQQDMLDKLDATGTDGVVVAYSAYYSPAYKYSQQFSKLDASFRYLFGHWSLVEEKDAKNIKLRDPNNPTTQVEFPIADFFKANSDVANQAQTFKFQDFEDKLGGAGATTNLHGMFQGLLSADDKKKSKAIPKTLPEVNMNLKGKLVTVSK